MEIFGGVSPSDHKNLIINHSYFVHTSNDHTESSTEVHHPLLKGNGNQPIVAGESFILALHVAHLYGLRTFGNIANIRIISLHQNFIYRFERFQNHR
jgi:hypothetical protein